MFDRPYHVITANCDYQGYGYCGEMSNNTPQEYASYEQAEIAAFKMSNCYNGTFLVVHQFSGEVLLRVPPPPEN